MGACRTCLLVTIRLMQLVCALGIIALGIWVVHIDHDIKKIMDEGIDAILGGDPTFEKEVTDFANNVLEIPKRLWFAIAAGCWAILAIIFISIHRRTARQIAHKLLIGIELLTFLLMLGALIAITTLAVKLEPLCIVIDEIPPLVAVFRVCPISKAWTATLALGTFLFTISLLAVLISSCRSKRKTQYQPASAVQFETVYPKTAEYSPETVGYSPQTPQTPYNFATPMAPQAYSAQLQQGYTGGYAGHGSVQYLPPVGGTGGSKV